MKQFNEAFQTFVFLLSLISSYIINRANGNEAGTTFDNSFFDNSFVFLQQLKNGSFLGPVFVHVTGRS